MAHPVHFAAFIQGGQSRSDYERLCPPRSFLHVSDFGTDLGRLARLIDFLGNSPEHLSRFHDWRSHFEVTNEHGYFQTKVFHYCRLCQALNYNGDVSKVYSNLEGFWSRERDCEVVKDEDAD